MVAVAERVLKIFNPVLAIVFLYIIEEVFILINCYGNDRVMIAKKNKTKTICGLR